MFLIDDTPIKIERYPDGTPRINVSADSYWLTLEWRYEKDEEFLLWLITRHLRERLQIERLNLFMPYVPHARNDRTTDNVQVFTLKYFCEFVNALKFDRVIVRDAHSAVTSALLNSVESEPIAACAEKLIADLLDRDKDIIFYPDEGSCKRYSELIKFPCAFGIKRRDWQSGKITGLDVQGEFFGSKPAARLTPFNALIIDDICSYGGTFLHSAKKLRELGADKIWLYVTHCENSILQGDLLKSENSGLLERIYTTRSIYSGNHPLIEILEDT
jgi:ribose-phosphate pyrophosphokinase